MTEGVCGLYSAEAYICHYSEDVANSCGCCLYEGALCSKNTLVARNTTHRLTALVRTQQRLVKKPFVDPTVGKFKLPPFTDLFIFRLQRIAGGSRHVSADAAITR